MGSRERGKRLANIFIFRLREGRCFNYSCSLTAGVLGLGAYTLRFSFPPSQVFPPLSIQRFDPDNRDERICFRRSTPLNLILTLGRRRHPVRWPMWCICITIF